MHTKRAPVVRAPRSAPIVAPLRATTGRKARATPPDITRVLRERIASQAIPPGSKLRETDLAEEFGVPRTRVRDALSVLEQRGLVERIPNRGAVVMRLDLSQVSHLYDVREVLEGLCARLATAKGSRTQWRQTLKYFQGPMARFVAAGDLDAYIAGYEAFRAEVIETAGNPTLAEMLDSIVERTQALIRRIIILPGRAEMGLRMHTAVIEAMCRGDAVEAERLRRDTLRSAKTFIDRYQKYIL